MTTWDILKILAAGIVIGGLLGFFIGERAVLRHLYNLWPTIQPVIIKAGYRDPARPWWKISPAYWLIVGAISLMVVVDQITVRQEAARHQAQTIAVQVEE